jgi:DNA-binding NarL/FixJ family response regulator
LKRQQSRQQIEIPTSLEQQTIEIAALSFRSQMALYLLTTGPTARTDSRTMRPIKILLSADMLLVRQALRALLEGEGDFLLVGEAADEAATIDLIAKLSPDVVLLDQGILGLAHLEWLRDIRRVAPTARLVVLSSGCGKQGTLDDLKRNVAAWVHSNSTYPSLVNAIRMAATGCLYPAMTISNSATQISLIENHKPSASTGDLLSARQREVLELAARGFTNREIALRLSISPRTVEVHRAKLMQKLALRDRAELIRFAFRSARLPRNAISKENAPK